MKIAYVSTFPPRQCGIATFSDNLVNSIHSNLLKSNSQNSASVIAIDNEETPLKYPPIVKFIIRQNIQKDYLLSANYINFSGFDLSIIEHEFGIFGAESGLYILSLISNLKIPLIVTLHTVNDNPTFYQKYIIEQIGKFAQKLVVMSNKAISFLKNIYNITEDKIVLIEHGVPDFPIFPQEEMKRKYHLEGRKLIMTFGFIGRNKGIENVIEALRKVVIKYPEVLYIISGNTHPEVLKHSGEEYRNFLTLLIKKYNLEKNVIFNQNFLPEQKIFEYLNACDIYITPYNNKEQITSGTLSYALGAGAAVLSTPYWHAEEVLSNGRGILFDFKNSEQLSEIILDLFDNPDKLQTLRKNSYEYGKNIKWSKIGNKYLHLIDDVIKNFDYQFVEKKTIIDTSLLPDFDLAHIIRMTDDTGIVQHANYSIPNLKEGYCIDDNARALLMTLMAYRIYKDKASYNLLPIYLSYIHYMQNSDGTFNNFLSFNRQFLDEQKGSEDSFGRTIWAIGYLIRFAPNDAYFQIGRDIFMKSCHNFDKLISPRAIANTILGISHYLHKIQDDENMLNLLIKLTKKITDSYEAYKKPDWDWFEDILTYDNGMLPLSLFYSYEITSDKYVFDIAMTTLKFLEKITMENDYLSVIGNDKWYKYGGERSRFTQQAVDVMSIVLLFREAYFNTNDRTYLEKMFKSFLWFLGENDLKLTLYDFETKGCCDGLHSSGVNRNQGAESTLAYLISYLTVISALELEQENLK